jgi:hypothetical protein
MRARAAALFGLLGLSHPRLAGRLPRPHVLWTCFCRMRKSSMFADMPLDNRTVDQFAAFAAVRLSQAVLKRCHGQNDLLFRPG